MESNTFIRMLDCHNLQLLNLDTGVICTSLNIRPDVQYYPERNVVTDLSGTNYVVQSVPSTNSAIDFGLFLSKLFHGRVSTRLDVDALIKLNAEYDFVYCDTILFTTYNKEQDQFKILIGTDAEPIYFTKRNQNIYNVDDKLILMNNLTELFEIEFISKERKSLSATQLV